MTWTQNFLKRLDRPAKYINSLFKPNIKFKKNKLHQEIAHTRNKAVFALNLVIALIACIQMIAGIKPVKNGLLVLLTAVIILVVLTFSWLLHPEVFKIAQSIILALGTLSVAHQNLGGIHRAWIGVQIYPTMILWCSGSAYHYLIHAAIQITYLNTIYQDLMINSVTYASPEDFTRSLTQVSNTMCCVNIAIVMCLQISLQKAYDRIAVAEQKSIEFERQKTFLLGFSHELRNLMNSLLGNIKLLKLETLTEKSKDILKTADLCGELLLHLVNNILDTGKAEIGDLEINPTPNNIYQTVERAWSICSELIRRKSLTGKIKIAKNIPHVLNIDRYRLTQILLNLVGNAVKFTDQGSIDISMEWIEDAAQVEEKHFKPYPFDDEDEFSEGVFQKNQKLSIFDENSLLLSTLHNKIDHSALRPNRSRNRGLLKITVTDTGCGIAKSDMETLFCKFTQVNSDASRRKLGTGLGLFITKQLCKKMQGKIKIFSKEREGSCFTVCLPVEPVTDNTVHILEEPNKRAICIPDNLKAFVIDDEGFSSHVLQSFLSHLKVEVLEPAVNGLLGYNRYVELIKRKMKPHIITLDLEMPVLDGKKAAELIREYEIKERVDPCLLIVVSGNCSESEISECLDVQGKIRANAFVKKPASLEELSGIILRHFAAN